MSPVSLCEEKHYKELRRGIARTFKDGMGKIGKIYIFGGVGGLAYIHIARNDASFKGKGLGCVQDQIFSTLFQQIIILEE